MTRLTMTAFALVVLAGIGFLSWYTGILDGAAGASAGVEGHQEPILHVDTIAAKVRSEPVLLNAVGQVETEHDVNLRAQVDGVLKEVFFQEGDEVKAGQKLFQIDPAPFEAQVESAKAALQGDQAGLANARAQTKRLAPLAKLNYVTPEEYQNAQTSADQAKANIASDKAALKQARIKLAYTTIRAPISGLTGNLNFKAGNVVSQSDSMPLVVINQIKPILVRFSIPQNELVRVRQFQRKAGIDVNVTQENSDNTLGTGKLVFINNTVAQNTGTIMLKASFTNKQEQLWPGQYVGVQLTLTTDPHAVVIPQTAVQVGQQGNYVFLVKNGKSHIQYITLNRQVGQVAVVEKGLKGGEKVVAHVPRNLEAGMKVKPEQTTGGRGQTAETKR